MAAINIIEKDTVKLTVSRELLQSKKQSYVARSLPVENLLPQNLWSTIIYLQ